MRPGIRTKQLVSLGDPAAAPLVLIIMELGSVSGAVCFLHFLFIVPLFIFLIYSRSLIGKSQTVTVLLANFSSLFGCLIETGGTITIDLTIERLLC